MFCAVSRITFYRTRVYARGIFTNSAAFYLLFDFFPATKKKKKRKEKPSPSTLIFIIDLQMTVSKTLVFLTANLLCTATAIFHEPSYYPIAEPYNHTGKSPSPKYRLRNQKSLLKAPQGRESRRS